jgi:hypothetical protein
LGLLEENAEFDDNALAAFNDKFKTPLSPRSITMLRSLLKKMEKVKKPKGRKVDAKKKATGDYMIDVFVASCVWNCRNCGRLWVPL